MPRRLEEQCSTQIWQLTLRPSQLISFENKGLEFQYSVFQEFTIQILYWNIHFFFHYLFAATTKICACGHSTRVYTLGFSAPCGSHPRSLGTAGAAGGAQGRCPREATTESPGCALPTVFRSLDCQPWQVWAAGSRFSHFRGDLTGQVSCYTSPYRGWGWVPVCWGRSREGQVWGGSVSFKRAFSPLPAPPPPPPARGAGVGVQHGLGCRPWCPAGVRVPAWV